MRALTTSLDWEGRDHGRWSKPLGATAGVLVHTLMAAMCSVSKRVKSETLKTFEDTLRYPSKDSS